MSRSVLCIGIALGLAISASLAGQTAFTTRIANLRAGPSRDYELVAQIPEGAPVSVAGCVNDWSWCDVIAGPDRGWVYAGSLVYPYEGRRVTILSSGPLIGFPIVTFAVGPYWDTYYRGRPWYGRRSYWLARPAPVFRPRAGGPHVVGRAEVRNHEVRNHEVRQHEARDHEVQRETSHAPRPAGREVQRAKPQPVKPQPVKPARPEKDKHPH